MDWYLPMSQKAPSQEEGQVQQKEPSVFTQVAPFIHGTFKHSFTSTNIHNIYSVPQPIAYNVHAILFQFLIFFPFCSLPFLFGSMNIICTYFALASVPASFANTRIFSQLLVTDSVVSTRKLDASIDIQKSQNKELFQCQCYRVFSTKY